MPTDIISVLRVALSNLRSWWFWLLFVALFVMGCGLKYVPAHSVRRLCQSARDLPLTPDQSQWIATVCSHRLPDLDFLSIAIGALTITVFLISAVPRPDARDTITTRTKQAEDVANPNTPIDAGAAKAIAEEYLNLSIRARQLRIALGYSLASGAAALLVPLQVTSVGTGSLLDLGGWNIVAAGGMLAHLAAQGSIAVVAATLGVFGFSQTRITRMKVALRLGGGGLFVGGAIATSVALPYLMAGPIPVVSPPQLLYVAMFRIAVLPALGAATAFLVLPRLSQAAPMDLSKFLGLGAAPP